MFAFTKPTLTNMAIPTRQPNAPKYLPTQSAWHPRLILQNFNLIGSLRIEGANIGVVPYD
jgi:hypothetical protein